MAFIVVYGANVLYPNTLRDLLIRISQAGLVQAKSRVPQLNLGQGQDPGKIAVQGSTA